MNLLEKIEAKKKKQAKQERNKKIALATSGVAVGTVVGTVAGVLVAPKAGKETIADAKETIAEAKEKVSERVSDNIKSTKNKVGESRTKIKEYLENRKSQESAEEEVLEVEADTELEEIEA